MDIVARPDQSRISSILNNGLPSACEFLFTLSRRQIPNASRIDDTTDRLPVCVPVSANEIQPTNQSLSSPSEGVFSTRPRAERWAIGRCQLWRMAM